MKSMRSDRLSRRSLLLLGMAAVTGRLLPGGWTPARAAGELSVRIGAVLPPERRGGAASLDDVVVEAARMGLRMAAEDLGLNAELLGARLEVLLTTSSSADEALRAGRRLASVEKVCALVGGFGVEQAQALARVAEEHGIPFFNIGATSDRLRAEGCSRYAFHVEASAAMYLDALAAWFVRAGHRRWFFVYEASAEGRELYERAIRGLRQRHWGAGEVGKAEVVPGETDYTPALNAIRRARPDVTLLLLPPQGQLSFLRQYDSQGLPGRVTGFPDPVTQTRSFLGRLPEVAPNAGAMYRATLWETTLDAYGARELNSRFMARWGQPMEPSAWAAFQAVKIVCDAALVTGSVDSASLMRYLEDDQTVFDVYKGIGVSFRPWDHQLRQALYLVKVEKPLKGATDLPSKVGVATLVGELPEIYRPGTDPVERLDQIGDLRRDSRCRLGTAG